MYGLARPFLFHLDAEQAHDVGLRALEAAYRTGLNPLLARLPAPLPTRAFGLTFPNPVGLAAGLDKNGAHIDALLALGFGFVEVGTVTPRAQEGNPKPRMFRLPDHQAVINRLGFNNAGVDALVRNVEKAQRKGGLLGINIGKNKDTPNEAAEGDYMYCLSRVYPLADYVTINISSPNTAGLRELQEEQQLRRLVGTLREEQERLGAKHGKRVPMLVKIAPDLSEDDIEAAGRAMVARASFDNLEGAAVRAHQYDLQVMKRTAQLVFGISIDGHARHHNEIAFGRIARIGIGIGGRQRVAIQPAGIELVTHDVAAVVAALGAFDKQPIHAVWMHTQGAEIPAPVRRRERRAARQAASPRAGCCAGWRRASTQRPWPPPTARSAQSRSSPPRNIWTMPVPTSAAT